MAFIDQGEFEVMKTLSSRRAPRCDQFCAKMTVSTSTVCDISLFERSGRNREESRKQIFQQKPYNFTTNTLKAYLSAQAVSSSAFVISKTFISGQKPRRRQLSPKVGVAKVSFFVFFLFCVYCASAPSLHREATDSLITRPRGTSPTFRSLPLLEKCTDPEKIDSLTQFNRSVVFSYLGGV